MIENKILLVCWTEPQAKPSGDTLILSFLSPSIEEAVRIHWKEEFISGREIAQQVKDKAANLYVDIVARIAATQCKKGKSLRESLRTKDGNSLWWYHNASFKDCEADPTFNQIIQLLTIQKVVEENEVKEITIWGADQSIVNVLKASGYDIKTYATKKNYVPILSKGLLSRFKYLITNLIKWLVIKKYVSVTNTKVDIAFSGFWDWSIKSDPVQDNLNDKYFKFLPEVLSKRGLMVGWFLWFFPYYEPGSRNRGLKEIILPAKKHNNLIFLQKYLKIKDYVYATMYFKPLLTYLRFRYQPAFKTLFKANGLDLFPLFSSHLLYHFCNSTLPHHVLVSKASQRVFKEFKPKFAISFLELFPYSRAFYTGARNGSPETLHGAVQHASYSREKTFVHLDHKLEFKGKPDGCPVPKPDYIFAMGELGRDIFIESGFPEEKVFLTGSSRYEHIANDDIHRNVKSSKIENLLMVTSLDRDLEMEMIETAYLATNDLPKIKLFLRSHPFAKMGEHPSFNNFKNRIKLTEGSLEEDLKNADLIIFSYSTVAEEALIRGIPVWQWLAASNNASVFRDLKVIPSFYSVSDLKESLKKFISDSESFIPSQKTRDIVLKKCFFAADGKSSERIADYIIDTIVNKNQINESRKSFLFSHNSSI